MTNTLVAITPLAISVIAIAIARQSALRAGLLGIACAVVIILTYPIYRIDAPTALHSLSIGLHNTLNISLVLFGGVSLYRVLENSGALQQIAEGIIASISEPTHRLLALVLGASVFFESSTGFGVGIVVVAPLYIALGYTPLQSAVLALLGQCAVPWGALSVGTVLGAEISGVPEVRLGALTAVYSFPVTALFGLAALRVAGLLSARAVGLLVLYSLTLSLLLLMCTLWLGVELAGCVAGLLVIVFAVVATSRQRTLQKFPVVAFVPFGVLMILLFITRLIPAVSSALQSVSVSVFANQPIAIFYHAGFLLTIAAVSGLLFYPGGKGKPFRLMTIILRQWSLATLAVATFIVLGQLMMDTDMTGQIARSIANFSPTVFLLLVPVIGALGGFLTASNAASNAIFMALQSVSAAELNLELDAVAAGQNAAGSNVTLASPGRLIFAASVTGESGSEASLLYRVAPVAVAGMVSASFVTYLLNRIV